MFRLLRKSSITPSVIDRITLTEERIEAIADATLQLIQLKDPISETLETIQKKTVCSSKKVRVPLGTDWNDLLKQDQT